ncbi:MAG: hypothetical protein RSN61_21345 [Chryseobacterium sp.]|uniref:hypothetical protein n=1 Tax=Chryseobacterium sp. TaxID=1871047 RepID=UPI002FCB0359
MTINQVMNSINSAKLCLPINGKDDAILNLPFMHPSLPNALQTVQKQNEEIQKLQDEQMKRLQEVQDGVKKEGMQKIY